MLPLKVWAVDHLAAATLRFGGVKVWGTSSILLSTFSYLLSPGYRMGLGSCRWVPWPPGSAESPGQLTCLVMQLSLTSKPGRFQTWTSASFWNLDTAIAILSAPPGVLENLTRKSINL